MNAQEIRSAYLEFFTARGHAVIERAPLVLREDPTTLFTGAGMQPLMPYLLGVRGHDAGPLLVDSQPCVRAQDIDEVGDRRHTTFFEMLGNWSLGSADVEQQVRWFVEFLAHVGVDLERLYVTCFRGSPEHGIPRDDEAARAWVAVLAEHGIAAPLVDVGSRADGDRDGMRGGRVFLYDAEENWWSRGGGLDGTPVGDPCGPDSEVFYDLGPEHHDPSTGEPHPASAGGRFVEIGNQVFMRYRRTSEGFVPLDEPSIDFGGGLERIAAAALATPDVFDVSLLRPLVDRLETLSGRPYEDDPRPFRVVADHVRAATFLAADGVRPGNKAHGYVLRRLVRRAVVHALRLGLEERFVDDLVAVVAEAYGDTYPGLVEQREELSTVLREEESRFRRTVHRGLRELEKLRGATVTGDDLFVLADTWGFPVELSVDEVRRREMALAADWREGYTLHRERQRARSRAAASGRE